MSEEQAISPASDAQEAPPAAPSAPSYAGSKHKVKVDEQELEIDYDELVRGYQKGSAANARFQRASEMQKAVQGFIERAKSGDLDWLDDVGVDDEKARRWAEKRLLRHIEWEQMTPEQRELHKLRHQHKELLTERERAQQEAAARAAQQAEAIAFKEIDEEISAALTALGKKPNPRLVRRMAEQMMASLSQEDGERMPAQKAASQAYQSLMTDAESLISELSPADLLGLLERAGKRDAVRREFVSAAVAQAPSGRSQSEAPDTTKRPKAGGKLKRMSTDEWFNRLEKRATR